MQHNRLEFSKKSHEVKRFIPASYRGRRKVKVVARETVRVSNFWDGGSKDTTTVHDFATGRQLDLAQASFKRQTQNNPYNQDIGEITLTPGVCAVEHSIFCGKDMGYRIYLHPETFHELCTNLAEGLE